LYFSIGNAPVPRYDTLVLHPQTSGRKSAEQSSLFVITKKGPAMPNTIRESSNYEYQVPSGQLDALRDIAARKGLDLGLMIWDAIDEYIQRENQTWRK
jgi:hypothetical protein